MEQYFEDLSSSKPLTDDEERQLAAKIKIGDATALEKLTKANLPFVVSIAKNYRGEGLEMDDLISEGNIGMMHAASKFDGSRGTRFVVFAAPYIRKAITDAIKEEEEVKNGHSSNTSSKRKGNRRTLSIDEPMPIGSRTSYTLQNVIANGNAPEADNRIRHDVMSQEIREGLQLLNDREKQVIISYFGLGSGDNMTMAEIAGQMNLKRERVRQIRDKAIRKLHKRIRR